MTSMSTTFSPKRLCPSTLEHVTASNGQSVAANFRAWFRDSKVVDSRGRPLVVYHGTDCDFTAFNKECIGNNFRADEAGFFFISDPKQASAYAENDTVGLNKRHGANVVPAYVALQRPLVVDDMLLRAEGMHPLGVQEDCVSFWDTYQSLVLEWAQAKRADGIILVDRTYRVGGEPTRMVVAFEPRQIKSALGNSGLYSVFSDELTDARAAVAPRRDQRQRQKVCP
jgi:hypothetical protein